MSKKMTTIKVKKVIEQSKSQMQKEKIYELIREKETHYLIFRKNHEDFYLANNTYVKPNEYHPTGDAIVCETTKTWQEVLDDKLALHELPKKLPNYIIDGFKTHLVKQVILSLYSEYKEFEDKRGGFIGYDDNTKVIKDSFLDAKESLVQVINSLSDIKDFYKFANLLQEHGAVSIYLLDLFVK